MDELSQRFFETLLQTQFLPPDRMLAYQRRLLDRLVRHARATVPFYRDSGRLGPLFKADGGIDWERWDEVPVLTRSEAQANAERLYAESLPPDCGEIRSGQTSGSTGKPLKFRVNTIMAAAGSAVLERALAWADAPPARTIGYLLNPKEGEGQYPLGTVYRARIRGVDRETHLLAARTPLEQQAEWIARLRPEMMMGYPGVLAQLAGNLPRALDDHRFALVVCIGEVLSDTARAAIEQGFRCACIDIYSGSEFGIVAAEDRKAKRMMVNDEIMLVETGPSDLVVDGDTLSELTVTPFYNYAMPLLRYSTGDLAVVDRAPAPDRRSLQRLKHIVGRQRDTFVLPSGRRWWPQFALIASFADDLEFDQIQYVQTARGRVELRFASRATQPLRNEAALMAKLQASAPEPIEFIIRQVPEIARQASGKYIDYVCEIAETG